MFKITSFFKPQSAQMQGSLEKSKSVKKKQTKQPRKRCSLVDSEPELSGDDHSGLSDDEWSDEEKERQSRFVCQSPVRERRKKLPRVSAEEKVVSEDELENLKDTCLEICKRDGSLKKRKKGYADEDDLANQSESDCSWISDSEELAGLERQASGFIRGYVERQGVCRKKAVNKKSDMKAFAEKAAAESAAEAAGRALAFEKEMKESRARAEQEALDRSSLIGIGCSIGKVRVRELNPDRQLASIFQSSPTHSSVAKAPKVSKAAVKYVAPGLVVNPVTKEVHYRHPDGRMSPRPGALC